ncbi:MAG: hypothetical protein K9N07_01290 [Candidatus Cloacimonetes bacterium]|nr:hypothetical protein [Candidatus Cloacimonadota bacterium]
MKIVKKILFFISLFLLYIIIREFIDLYTSIQNINIYAGYGFLIVLASVTIYFVIIPIFKIIRIPRNYGPARSLETEKSLISKRMIKFRNNKFLLESGFDFSELDDSKESYLKIVKVLEKEVDKIRRRHVSQLFYSTSIAQNGFLDALFILSASINHIKEIFILYNGRVSNRDLLTIAKKVYYSMAIGGSEGAEYATEEVFSKLATDSLKSIPFIDKILSSIVDGLVNATLLTRISFITENYCKLTYLKSDRDIYPSPAFVINSAKNITADMVERTFKSIRKMTFEKSVNFALVAANPIGYVLGKTIDRSGKFEAEKKEKLKEHAKLVGNPLIFGLEKLIKSLR